jgi:hypothetical protein
MLDGMHKTHLKLAFKRPWVTLNGLVRDFDYILLILSSMYTERKTGWLHGGGDQRKIVKDQRNLFPGFNQDGVLQDDIICCAFTQI